MLPQTEGRMMIDKEIEEKFGLIWPRHVSSLTQFLIDCRRHFRGDLDLFLVLCVIGDRTFSARHAPADLSYEAWAASTAAGIPALNINVQSVAEYTGIPRETVRRKLALLVSKGWVIRDGRGYVTATNKAKDDLAPLTLSSLAYLSRMKAVLGSS